MWLLHARGRGGAVDGPLPFVVAVLAHALRPATPAPRSAAAAAEDSGGGGGGGGGGGDGGRGAGWAAAAADGGGGGGVAALVERTVALLEDCGAARLLDPRDMGPAPGPVWPGFVAEVASLLEVGLGGGGEGGRRGSGSWAKGGKRGGGIDR